MIPLRASGKDTLQCQLEDAPGHSLVVPVTWTVCWMRLLTCQLSRGHDGGLSFQRAVVYDVTNAMDGTEDEDAI
jgi:hypothetical protein